jgi:hypothetical protein
MKRQLGPRVLDGAVPLYRDTRRSMRVLMLVQNDGQRTVRSWTLNPPPGTHAVVGAAACREAACTDEQRAALAAMARAAPPPRCDPCHPPLEVPPALGMTRELAAWLASGEAPADPDPPPPTTAPDFAALAPILDTSADHTAAAPTARVQDYSTYVLPIDTPGRYLETVNGCDRDERLRFVESTHTYFVRQPDGSERKTNGSVTFLAHKYEHPFERDAIVRKLQASKNWPRARYCRGTASVATLEQTKAWTVLAFVAADGQVLDTVDIDTRRFRRDATLVVAERPVTGPEICLDWELLALRAANRGTEVHHQIELFLNRDGYHGDTAEFASFARFARDVMVPLGMKAFRTEWRIFCDEANVAGSVDCVVRMPDGSLGIIDWKRSTKVREKLHASGAPFERGLLPPLDHLDGTVVTGYALQLNLYKRILEQNYGVKVSCLVLAQVGPDDSFYTFVPDMPLETEYIMASHCVQASDDDDGAAEARRDAAHEALMANRATWAEIMPPGGIQLDGWRRGDAAAPASPSEPRKAAPAVEDMFQL